MSALLTVHAGVGNPELAEALRSIRRQTYPPDEVVIVEDGPLPDDLLELIDALAGSMPSVARIRLAENAGAGVANQMGLEGAHGDWIAKMDADDVNLPHRLERQMAAVSEMGADVCGAAMLEFAGALENVVSLRRMPPSHDAIARRMRWNNPINHPTAFYRREVALAAGGYPAWRNMQDYGLMARMQSAGARMMNLPDPLVLFRTSEALVSRRRSSTARDLEVTLQRELRALGVVSAPRSVFNVLWRSAFRRLPTGALAMVSRRVLARHLG